jgi:hypothetical protein
MYTQKQQLGGNSLNSTVAPMQGGSILSPQSNGLNKNTVNINMNIMNIGLPATNPNTAAGGLNINHLAGGQALAHKRSQSQNTSNQPQQRVPSGKQPADASRNAASQM